MVSGNKYHTLKLEIVSASTLGRLLELYVVKTC